MSDTEVIEERGEYRATLQQDIYPNEPENDYGCPILRVDEWNRISDTGYGSHSAKESGIDGESALAHFLERNGNTSDAVDVFDRWLRIWHGGGAVGYHLGYSREYGYVSYVTEKMAVEAWGYDAAEWHEGNTNPEITEWQAWCEGEVYIVTVQRKVKRNTTTTTLDGKYLDETSTDDWDDVEGPVGGYYGYDYAVESAKDMLSVYAKAEVPA